MLKMPSFDTNTRTVTFASLINCVIDALSQAVSYIGQILLQIIYELLSGKPAAAFRRISYSQPGLVPDYWGHRSGAMNAGVFHSRS